MDKRGIIINPTKALPIFNKIDKVKDTNGAVIWCFTNSFCLLLLIAILLPFVVISLANLMDSHVSCETLVKYIYMLLIPIGALGTFRLINSK